MDYTDGLHTITKWFECDNSQVIIYYAVKIAERGQWIGFFFVCPLFCHIILMLNLSGKKFKIIFPTRTYTIHFILLETTTILIYFWTRCLKLLNDLLRCYKFFFLLFKLSKDSMHLRNHRLVKQVKNFIRINSI